MLPNFCNLILVFGLNFVYLIPKPGLAYYISLVAIIPIAHWVIIASQLPRQPLVELFFLYLFASVSILVAYFLARGKETKEGRRLRGWDVSILSRLTNLNYWLVKYSDYVLHYRL